MKCAQEQHLTQQRAVLPYRAQVMHHRTRIRGRERLVQAFAAGEDFVAEAGGAIRMPPGPVRGVACGPPKGSVSRGCKYR